MGVLRLPSRSITYVYVCIDMDMELARKRWARFAYHLPRLYIAQSLQSCMFHSNEGSLIHLFAHNYTHLSICIPTAPSRLSRMYIEDKGSPILYTCVRACI